MPKGEITLADVFDELLERIETGRYGEGSRLPTSKALGEELGTSRDTVNRAMGLLIAEGFLEDRGEGTRGLIVSPHRMRMPGLVSRFDLEIEKSGLKSYEKNIDDPAVVPAPPDIAQMFGIQSGLPLTRRFRLQGEMQLLPQGKGALKERKIPYRIAENYYPVDLADQEILEQMQNDERSDVLLAIKERHGQIIDHAHEDTLARLPRKRERELLQITVQTPVLEVKRISFSEDNTIIMVNKIVFVSFLFVFSRDYPVLHWK